MSRESARSDKSAGAPGLSITEMALLIEQTDNRLLLLLAFFHSVKGLECLLRPFFLSALIRGMDRISRKEGRRGRRKNVKYRDNATIAVDIVDTVSTIPVENALLSVHWRSQWRESGFAAAHRCGRPACRPLSLAIQPPQFIPFIRQYLS